MNEIEGLLAREQIRDQLSLYCQGVDGNDWELVRSCFADDHQHDHAPFKGSRDEFIEFASGVMKSVAVSRHSITNVIINLSEDGLTASSEANFTSIHFIEGSAGQGLSFASGDEDMDWMVVGSYSDQWVLRDGKWLINRRKSTHHWDRIEPSSKTG